MIENEKIIYQRLLDHANSCEEESIIAKLESIAPYPDPSYPEESLVKNGAFLRRELCRLGSETMMRHLPWDDFLRISNFEKTISPHLSLNDLFNSIFGGDAAVFRPPYILAKDYVNVDLPKEVGCSFDVPIFFFTGAHDWQTPISLSDNWFDQICAPYKELVHFANSGHFIVNEEPGKILMALVSKVLPFCKEDGCGERIIGVEDA